MIKHTLNYLSIPLFSVFLGIISVPILTHLMQPNEYGSYMTFMAFLGIANIVMTLNFHTSIGRYWYEKDGNIPSFITISMAGAFSLLCLSAWIVFNSPYLQKLLALDSNMVKYLTILVFIDVFFVVYNQILSPQRETKKLAYLSISKMYITFIFGILFIYILPVEKFLSLIFAQILIGLLYVLYIFYKIKHYVRFHFNKAQIFYIISYSGPMFFYSLSAIFMAQIDRIMITKLISTEQTGMYSFAFTIVNFFIMASSAIMAAWTPNFFEHMEAKLDAKVQEGTKNIIAVSFIVAAFVILFGNYIGYVMSSQAYHQGLAIIPVLVLAMYFSAGYQLYARSISYSKKTLYLALTFSIAGVINIALNYQLIPLYGIIGAAIATLIANTILMSGGYLVNRFILKYNDHIFLPFLKSVIIIVLLIGVKIVYGNVAYFDFFIASIFFSVICAFFFYIHKDFIVETFLRKLKNGKS